MTLRFVIFISIVLGITFGGNFYILHRLAGFFQIKKRAGFYILVVVLALSYVIATMLDTAWSNWFTKVLHAAAATWLGVGFLFICTLLVNDLLRIFVKFPRRKNGVVVICIVGVLSIYSLINAITLRVKAIEIAAPVDMDIVQLSDIHLGSTGIGFLKRVIKKTNSLEPDVVVITGDMLDPDSRMTDEHTAIINEFKPPVFFVTGNHERYANLDRVMAFLAKTKVKVLRSEAVDFGGLRIIGIDDSQDASWVDIKLAQIKSPDSDFSILLNHRPVGFEVAAEKGVDLMLSGHTHNGQIFPFNFIVRRIFDRINGLYEYQGSCLYVSSGTGTWGPRMRLGSASEIVLVKLRKKTKTDKEL